MARFADDTSNPSFMVQSTKERCTFDLESDANLKQEHQ